MTSPSHPDFVVVDDTSTVQPEQIKYSAGWTAETFTQDVGSTGPPLYQTLHVANSNAGFTFTYNGAAGPLFIVGSILTNSFPTWNCTLDNKPMSSISNAESTTQNPSNHVQICLFDSQTTPVGDHTVRVSVAASQDNPAYFDYILYTPAPTVRPGDLFFQSGNVGIQYTGSGWQQDANNGFATSNEGDTLDFEFNGHTVSWIGSYDGTQGTAPANATYSIDGSPPVNFTIQNTATGSTTLTEQVFFQTAPQGTGRHHLQVVYHGAGGSSGSGTPLALDHLIIQNSTADFELTPFPAVASSNDAHETLSFLPVPLSQATATLPSSSSGKKGVSSSLNSSPTTTLKFIPSFTQPPSSSSTRLNGTSSDSKPSHSAIIAGACMGVFGMLCVAFVLGRRVWKSRRRTSSHRDSALLARPFPDSHTDGGGDGNGNGTGNSDKPPPVPEKRRQEWQPPSSTNTNTFLSDHDLERQSPSIPTATASSSTRPSKARRLAEVVASSALRRYRSHTSNRNLTNTQRTRAQPETSTRTLVTSISDSDSDLTLSGSGSTATRGNGTGIRRPSRVIMHQHQDSGVQLRQPQPLAEGEEEGEGEGEVEVIDVPPAYASIK